MDKRNFAHSSFVYQNPRTWWETAGIASEPAIDQNAPEEGELIVRAQYFYSDSTKFSGLNRIAVVFEYEADAEGNTKSKLFVWK